MVCCRVVLSVHSRVLPFGVSKGTHFLSHSILLSSQFLLLQSYVPLYYLLQNCPGKNRFIDSSR